MLPNRNHSIHEHNHTLSLIHNLEQPHQPLNQLSFHHAFVTKPNLLKTLTSLTQYKINKTKYMEHLSLGQMILEFNSNKKHRIGHKRYKTHGKGILGAYGQCQSGSGHIRGGEGQGGHEGYGGNQGNLLQISELGQERQIRTVRMKSVPNSPNQQLNTNIVNSSQQIIKSPCQIEQQKNTKIQFSRKPPSLNNRAHSYFSNNVESQKLQQETGNSLKFVKQNHHKKMSTKDMDRQDIKKFYVITEQSETSYQTGSKIIDSDQYQSLQWGLQNNNEAQTKYCLKQKNSQPIHKHLKLEPIITSRYFTENKQNQNIQQQQQIHEKNKTQKLLYNMQQDLQVRIGLPISLRSSKKTKSQNSENLTKMNSINNQLDLGMKIIDDSFQVQVAQTGVYYDPWAIMNIQDGDCQNKGKNNYENKSANAEGVVLDQSIVSPQCQKLRSQLEEVLNSQSLANTYQFYSPQVSYDYGGKTLKSKKTMQRSPYFLIPTTKSTTFYSQPITTRDQQLWIEIKHSVSQLTLLSDTGLVFARTLYQINCHQKNYDYLQQFLEDLELFQHPNIMKVYSIMYTDSMDATLNPSNIVFRQKNKDKILCVYKQPILSSGVYQSVYSLHDIIQSVSQFTPNRPQSNPKQLLSQLLQIISTISKLQSSIKLDTHNIFVCQNQSPNKQQLKLDISNTVIMQIEQLLSNQTNNIQHNVRLLRDFFSKMYEEYYYDMEEGQIQCVLFLNLMEAVEEMGEMCDTGREFRQEEIWVRMDVLAMHPYFKYDCGNDYDQQSINKEIFSIIL